MSPYFRRDKNEWVFGREGENKWGHKYFGPDFKRVPRT